MPPAKSGLAPRRRSARLSAGRDEIPKEDDTEPAKAFRFLDFPAEIRNSIYHYAVACNADTPAYNLANFRDPAIALVSRQTRSESLPILYSDAKWIITVGCNFCEVFQWRNAGNLGVKVGTKKLLRLAGGAAVFRDVTFRVFSHGQARGARPHAELDAGCRRNLIATLDVKTHPKAEYDVTKGEYYHEAQKRCHLNRMTPIFVKKMDGTLDAAKAVFQKICARDGFKGLTLRDLDKIAKAFRIMPPQSPSCPKETGRGA